MAVRGANVEEALKPKGSTGIESDPTKMMGGWKCLLLAAVVHGKAITEKTALVTGSSSGIGLEIAKALAGAGMQVIMCARRTEKLEAEATAIKASGKKIKKPLVTTCDVANGESLDATFAFVENSAEIKFTFRDDLIFYFLTVCVVRSRSCDHSKARQKNFRNILDFFYILFYLFYLFDFSGFRIF